LLSAAGCSSQARHKVLTFFFTGVDQPSTAAAAATQAPAADTNAPTRTLPPEPVLYLHEPYAQRQCTACHVGELSQELKVEGSALCLECHAKILAGASRVHAPVADGRCDLCHSAHQSEQPRLLTRKAQDLCLDCHPLEVMRVVSRHSTLQTDDCVKCHEPHRSELKALLRTPP
jgi:predicted CXXCH cytochrome family protein